VRLQQVAIFSRSQKYLKIVIAVAGAEYLSEIKAVRLTFMQVDF
jgi:hypothetical protein